MQTETVIAVEGHISVAAMRGGAASPWSKTPSRTKRTRRNQGDLVLDRTARIGLPHIGKARSRSQ